MGFSFVCANSRINRVLYNEERRFAKLLWSYSYFYARFRPVRIFITIKRSVSQFLILYFKGGFFFLRTFVYLFFYNMIARYSVE